MKLLKIQLTFIICALIQLSSCVENQSLSEHRRTSSSSVKKTDSDAENSSKGTASNAVSSADSSSSESITDIILEHGKAELMHLVDPVEGKFYKKVTIPKNYAGYFYLSGLNITSLSSRIVSVLLFLFAVKVNRESIQR